MRKHRHEKILSPVRPNCGIEAAMRDKLKALVEEMDRSVKFRVKAAYRKTPPVLAQDASPATQLKLAINALTRRWQNRFDDAAKDLAKYFTTKMYLRSDANLRAILK